MGQKMGQKKEWTVKKRKTHGSTDHPVPVFHGMKPEFIVIHKVLGWMIQKFQGHIPINKSSGQISVIGDYIPFNYTPIPVFGPGPVMEYSHGTDHGGKNKPDRDGGE